MTAIGGDIPGANIVETSRTIIHFVDDDHIEPGRSSGQDTTHTGRIIDPTVSLHGEQTGAIGLFDRFTRGEADAPVITKSLEKEVAGGRAGDVTIQLNIPAHHGDPASQGDIVIQCDGTSIGQAPDRQVAACGG